jgi:CNT family concentrative nucleoside transporter
MAPNKKSQIAALGLFAVLAGSLANLMTATIAGMLF